MFGISSRKVVMDRAGLTPPQDPWLDFPGVPSGPLSPPLLDSGKPLESILRGRIRSGCVNLVKMREFPSDNLSTC